MAIQLSPEQEQVVGQAIHAGLIRIPDDVVGVGIETIRQRLEARDAAVSYTHLDVYKRQVLRSCTGQRCRKAIPQYSSRDEKSRSARHHA